MSTFSFPFFTIYITQLRNVYRTSLTSKCPQTGKVNSIDNQRVKPKNIGKHRKQTGNTRNDE